VRRERRGTWAEGDGSQAKLSRVESKERG